MTVVAARELEDPVAPRRAAREPDRAHRGFGARADHPHLLDRRERVDDLVRELDLALGRRAEGRARRRPCCWTASTVSRSAWPKISGPNDMTQSTYRLPSASSTYAPFAASARRAARRARRRASRAPASSRRPGIRRSASSAELGLRLQSQVGELLGPVGDDEVGARPPDRGQRLESRPAARRASRAPPPPSPSRTRRRRCTPRPAGRSARARRGSRRGSGAPA